RARPWRKISAPAWPASPGSTDSGGSSASPSRRRWRSWRAGAGRGRRHEDLAVLAGGAVARVRDGGGRHRPTPAAGGAARSAGGGRGRRRRETRRPVAARAGVHRFGGAVETIGRFARPAPSGGAGARLLPLSDALRSGPLRDLDLVAQARLGAGDRLPRADGEHRSPRHAGRRPPQTGGGAAGGERGRPGGRGQLAVSRGGPGVDSRARRRGRVSLRARSDERSVRAPGGVMVLTPDGRVSHYLYGVNFRLLDVRLGMTEAASGKVAGIGGIVDRVLLTCFRYDPSARKYGFYVSAVLKGGASLVILSVGGLLGVLWRRDARRLREGGRK